MTWAETLLRMFGGAWCVLSILTMAVCALAPLWMGEDEGGEE